MVAVCLYDDLPSHSGNLAQQASELRLRSRVEMYLRLLQQEHIGAIMTIEFREERERLADTITHINEIAPRTPFTGGMFPYLDLEGAPTRTGKTINTQFVEQAGATAERYQRVA